ncbi:hypothetical protein [Romboutsia timonensis]|uniref:hypothetical protein n=1 Tax=Romboutsia timonensis TaxID=1776391 RepID=UPI00399AC29C
MNKFKNGLKKILSYIAARRLLRYSIIVVVIILLPTGVILTNKYFNNKVNNIEDTKEESLNINDSDKIKDNSITKGIIETDVVADKTYSKHTLSDGFSTLSEDDYNSSSNTDKNNITNSTSNNISQSIDKSSLTGIDLEILEGYEFNPKKDLKLQATDKDGRNISDNIIIEKNNVNTTIPGSYIVKASVKLSNGQYKEREFNVIVKETTLEVSLKSFKSIKVNIKKGEKIGFDLDLKVSKKHVTPTSVMINGQIYPLYKGNENIIDKLTNTKNYKVFIDGVDVSGVYNYTLDHIKMSNGSWINVGEHIQSIEVLKDEGSIKNFSYEEKSADKKVDIKFDLNDLENTTSNLKLEFYKDDNLLETIKLDKKQNYCMSLPVNSNGIYSLKILSDINLNQNTNEENIVFSKEIFTTTINISNIDQTSITGNDIEITEGQEFDAIKDLGLKATDFDGEDITHKIEVNNNDIDVNKVEKQSIIVSIINKNGKKYTKEFYVTVNPISKSEFSLSRILHESFTNNKSKTVDSRATSNSSILNGDDTQTLIQKVEITGAVTQSDGSLPEGRLEVEIPTSMSFTVDQKGNFSAPNYTVRNYSSVPISVYLSDFRETIPNGGINVKMIAEDITSQDRSNVHLALVGNEDKYIDLGEKINNPKEILTLQPSCSYSVQLLGESGKNSSEDIDKNGISEEFTILFTIKKN